ncbi:hypothetical protein DPMN_042617 [Dreissena polymorpha]|uniref:Uncharacterized protein n=1 Tax=Dreissena polymorpha TaxID=45954 RepID=A0A9D4HX47_DREPO|nr:hypothetical protein DPMN_042617 [Dreissena polymorpha]
MAPEIVVVVLGENDISTTERPNKIAWNIVQLCLTIRDRGMPHVVVVGICRWWQFRDATLDAAQFANMAAYIDKYVAKKFALAYMFHVKEEGHWVGDRVHLSKEGERVFLDTLRSKFLKMFG